MPKAQSKYFKNVQLSENAIPGIALSSGGALGLSHIGVLKAFITAGIHFPVIAGTSMGAIIGAAYACGTLQLAEQLARSITRQDMMRWVDLHWRGGLLKGDLIEGLLRKFTKNLTFEDLRNMGVNLVVVACDLNTGDPVYLSQGDIAKAVRASISIPGIFVSVKMQDVDLVDGGLVDSIPVGILQKMGAEFTVGVDVSNTNDIWSRAKFNFVSSAQAADKLWGHAKKITADAANAGTRRLEMYYGLAEKFLLNGTEKAVFGGLKLTCSKHRDPTQISPRNNQPSNWSGLRTIIQSANILIQNINNASTETYVDTNKTNILLRPDIRPYHAHQYYKASDLIERGRLTAQEALLNLVSDSMQCSEDLEQCRFKIGRGDRI